MKQCKIKEENFMTG